MATWGLDFWVSSTSFQKNNIGWPRQPPTWYFMILTKNIGFRNIKIKLNSWTWMTLQSSVVIFQALEPFQPQWPLQPQQPQFSGSTLEAETLMIAAACGNNWALRNKAWPQLWSLYVLSSTTLPRPSEISEKNWSTFMTQKHAESMKKILGAVWDLPAS